MTLINSLRQCRFFDGLDQGALAAVAHDAQQRELAADSFFFHQGEIADVFYILLTGHARMIQTSPEGQQVILGVVGPYREVGIVAAIKGAEYPVAVQAVQDCAVLAWDQQDVAAMLERSPVLALRALRMVAGRFVQLQNRYRELATERVERRIARALLRLSGQVGKAGEGGVELSIPLSRQDLAEMTGTTLYTVSRILSSWEKQGIVASGRERVALRLPHRLHVIAEDMPE